MNIRCKCHFLHNKNPYLHLAPFKYEKLNDQSEIGLIHDFLSEEECHYVRKISRSKLKSTPYNVGKSRREYSPLRTSKNAMFSDDEDERLGAISRRIKSATRMNTREVYFEESEKIQVN